jgi:hypothetical protein
MTGIEGGEPFDLDSAMAVIQGSSGDVRILMRLLARELADVLGPRMSVERTGGWLKRSDDVKAMEVTLGDDVMSAQVHGSSVECMIGHSSGGIRIRSEKVGMDEWLRRLLAGLNAEASKSEQARQALENLMIGGTQ